MRRMAEPDVLASTALEREAFERWVLSGQSPEGVNLLQRLPGGDYLHQSTFVAWVAWQARADLVELTLEQALRRGAPEVLSGCAVRAAI